MSQSPRNPVSSSQAVIHHAAALRVVQAALAKAESLGIKVCVAVMDSSGTLAGFARMPGAFLISGDIAMKKAYASAAIADGLFDDPRRLAAAIGRRADRIGGCFGRQRIPGCRVRNGRRGRTTRVEY